ncbi:Ribonuclease [Streptococcus sanguinis]|jgi:hypothetical protein|uniref:LXG domain-containing protein n=1 Tax=Streptococcus sanguinis (strain SK36) TaxID=388919 RepID=A3CR31_STRSV|nr:hypothetical protein [Streptococcus sanguinis]ABN45636.1 Conserved hypothetical protein [Streptococcus sanguinis SK36]MBZ2055574.1 hypothetical protein [Streptococcus sanguinis]RSI17957.1 Ribonuclease [Streptococcus sanguinis]
MVKMVLGSSDKQSSTMSSVAQARVAAYNQAISALTNFNGTGELTGAAYDSGKNYGMSTIIPLIKGALMYAESLGESVPKLPSKYRAEVCGEDLDSAELERDIRGLESSLAGLRGVYRAMEKNDDVSPSSLQSISARMDDLTSEKNKKMEQLRKLNLFAGSSNAVFGGEDGIKSIDGLLGNIVTGINQVQTEFANFGGTFPSHSNDMEWAKNIEGEWTKKAEIDKNYQKVLEKLKDGKKLDEKDIKAIQAYQSRYPARDLPENVKQAMSQKEAEKRTAQEIVDGYKAVLKKVDNNQELTQRDIQLIALYGAKHGQDKIPDKTKKYIQNQTEGKVNNDNWGEFLSTVLSTSLEEGSKYGIDKIKVENPKISDYFKYFPTTDKLGNINISYYADSKGYTDALTKTNAMNFIKGATISEFDVPIPGTNSSVGISGISSVFMGLDFMNNLNDENAGRAFTHTATNVMTTAVIAETLTVGTAVAAEAIGMTTVAAAVLSNPVGWAIGAGIVASVVANVAYENNFLGIKDIANEMGDNLDKGIKDVGKAFDSGIKSVQKVFGW